jgi:hypothetical protein
MPYTRIHSLARLRAAFKIPIGSGAALLMAFACATAIGEERTDVHTAFRNVVDEEPSPPSHPGPVTTTSNGHSSQSDESLPAPSSEATACYVPNHMTHCCPPPAYTRWPIIGPLHRRWITHTKPHLQATHWGYPEYFEERPYGSYVLQAEQMQIFNGLRDQQVLYNYDFVVGTAELKPRGEYELQKIIRRMQTVPCAIIVQTTDVNNPNPELDEARRQAVLEVLRKSGVPATDDLVVTDRPPVPGLQGSEGIMVYGNMLLQTQERGGGFDFDPSGDTGGSATNVNIYSGSNNTFN